MKSVLNGYAYRRNVSPELFANMTDWLMQWQSRVKDMEFSVLLIEFLDVGALGSALGAKQAASLIARVEHEIVSSLRMTDLMCRVRACSFWILLPEGDPCVVIDRIEPILSAAREDGLDASHMRVAKLTVSATEQPEMQASHLFDQLRAARDHDFRPRRDTSDFASPSFIER